MNSTERPRLPITHWNLSILLVVPPNETDDNGGGQFLEEDDLYDVPPEIIVLLSFCYGLISLVAVLGNACVLIIVATSRRMRTVTNYFIANLAVADIVIGLFSIPFQFQAALLQRWVLPDFMCPFCPFIQVLSVNVSIVTLTAIAVDRFRAVWYPLRARTGTRSSKFVILAIWVFGAAAGVPYAVALRVTPVYAGQREGTKPFCHNVRIPSSVWKVYNHALVTVQYFLPLLLITGVYLAIAVRLKETEAPGNKQGDRDAIILKSRKKVIKMLFIVVLLFALCWLPFQMYNILQEIFPEINSYKYINVIWFCSHWLAMSNSCYNPFIYAIYNERFNTEFKNRCGCWLSLFRPQVPDSEKALETSLSSRYG